MRRSALKNMIKIILLGCCLIMAALGAALFCWPAQPAIPAAAADLGDLPSKLGNCPDCGTRCGYTSVSATCTSGGRDVYNCPNCGTVVATSSALGHKYGSYVETSAPTCTSAGVETATCSRCGDAITRTGDPALGHSYGSWTTVSSATCTSGGTQRGTCSRC